MKDSFTNISKIFSQKKYFFFLFSISLIFFVLNVTIKNFNTVKRIFSVGILEGIIFFSTLIIGFKETVPVATFILVIIISLLTGLLFTVMIYKVASMRKISGQLGLFGVMGVFLGVFIPGCVACSVGVLGVLGITGSTLALLPFKGLELQIISIVLLSFGILYSSCNISNSCSVDYSRRRGKFIIKENLIK